jgi:hypothetical protein
MAQIFASLFFLSANLSQITPSQMNPEQRLHALEQRLHKIEEQMEQLQKQLEYKFQENLSTEPVAASIEIQLGNIQNEITTYIKAPINSANRRLELVTPLLLQMQRLMGLACEGEHDRGQLQQYGLFVVEQYMLLDWLTEAKHMLDVYEEWMLGRPMPQQFYAIKLDLLDRLQSKREQEERYFQILSLQEGNLVSKKDVMELSAFGAQLNDFITPPWDKSNGDFQLLCQRLKEYKWAKQPRRHVIIMNRLGQLLFSSLEGTQSLDCYQDQTGRSFFKEISNLGDRLQTKQVEGCLIKILVGSKEMSYSLIYTYSPANELFIVVRIPHEKNS